MQSRLKDYNFHDCVCGLCICVIMLSLTFISAACFSVFIKERDRFGELATGECIIVADEKQYGSKYAGVHVPCIIHLITYKLKFPELIQYGTAKETIKIDCVIDNKHPIVPLQEYVNKTIPCLFDPAGQFLAISVQYSIGARFALIAGIIVSTGIVIIILIGICACIAASK